MSNRLETAIVVQGRYIGGFTDLAIRFYLTNNLDSIIVFSTWDEPEISDLTKFCLSLSADENERFYLVKSELPKVSGYQNVNYQIKSTLAGMMRALDLGVKYAAKVRSDFLIEKPGIIDYYFQKVPQKNILLSLETVNPMSTIFFVSDFFIVGPVGELIKYFNCPLVFSGDNRLIRDQVNDRLYYSDFFYFTKSISSNAERYLLLNYLRLSGYVIPNTCFEASFFWPRWLFSSFYLADPNELHVKAIKEYSVLRSGKKKKFHKVRSWYLRLRIYRIYLSLKLYIHIKFLSLKFSFGSIFSLYLSTKA